MQFKKIIKKIKGLVNTKKNNSERNELENLFKDNLMFYCNISDIEAVKDTINIVGDLNFISEAYDDSPLTLAVKQNSLEMVNLLIENGADVNFKNRKGHTPLTLAIKRSSLEIVNLLIKNGANVDLKNDKGHTPLILAVRGNSLEMVNLLIENGANVDLKSDKGSTPLIYATKKLVMSNDTINIIKTLIKHNTNINIADKKGRTPLMWACITQFVCVIEVDDETNRFQIQKERLNKDYLVNLLLQKGANIHMMDKDGNTALMYAIDCSSKEVIKSLLKYNGTPKYANKACMGLNINDLYIAKKELDYIQKSEWFKFEGQKIKEFSELVETLNSKDIKQMLQEKYKAIDDKISIQINTLDNLAQRGVDENLKEIKEELIRRSRNEELQVEILDMQKLFDTKPQYAKDNLLNKVNKAKNNLAEIKNFESRIDVYEKKEILDMIDLSKKGGVKVADIKNYRVQTNDIKTKPNDIKLKHKGFLRCIGQDYIN